MQHKVPEIKVLSEDVANKIAAGEVIERPASAVKELIENAIDAKATKIDIEFRNGGKSFIRISDNGHGMTKEQMPTALEPHATSKIHKADDLDKVLSFGFRGEALPSIASISKFTMRSKTSDAEVGSEIQLFAGKIAGAKECAMTTGTEFIIEDIFCSVPARRKFLKSDNTEADHITKICRLYAIARPEVSFALKENGRFVFKSAKTENLLDQIKKIFGAELSDKMIELPRSHVSGIEIQGAISAPNEAWASARNIYTFINGRPVESRIIYSALKEAYKNAIPQGKYPAAFFFIKLDTRLVDVNVHPAKKEVRLSNEYALRFAILNACTDTLDKFILGKSAQEIPQTQTASDTFPKPAESVAESPRLNQIIDNFSENKSVQNKAIFYETPKPPFFNKSVSSPMQNAAAKAYGELQNKKFTQEIKETNSTQNAVAWRYLCHLGKKYILFETNSNSLIILSIPESIKRINYDKILRSLEGEKPKVQHLLIPVNMQFDRVDDEIFCAARKAFESCGFGIENFGERYYRICATPIWVDFEETQNLIRDFIEKMKDEGINISRRILADTLFAKLACGYTSKKQVPANEFAAKNLIDSLFECKSPMFSPEGKRTCKEITASEIRNYFGE